MFALSIIDVYIIIFIKIPLAIYLVGILIFTKIWIFCAYVVLGQLIIDEVNKSIVKLVSTLFVKVLHDCYNYSIYTVFALVEYIDTKELL